MGANLGSVGFEEGGATTLRRMGDLCDDDNDNDDTMQLHDGIIMKLFYGFQVFARIVIALGRIFMAETGREFYCSAKRRADSGQTNTRRTHKTRQHNQAADNIQRQIDTHIEIVETHAPKES